MLCSYCGRLAAQIKEPVASRIGRLGVSFKFIQEQALSGSVEVKYD
jgi:hypothetical protein